MSAFGIDVDEEAVCLFPEGTGKRDALNQMVDAIAKTGCVTDVEAFRKAVHDREAVMSTGIGGGVAIPHVRINEVQKPVIGIGISSAGIDFNTLDGLPVRTVILFAMPSGSQREYLSLLAEVMRTLKPEDFRERLAKCATAAEVIATIDEG